MIRARDLVKDYGTLRAVDGLNLSVRAGQIVGLLGPNGSGKSTTQRMLAGLMEPTSGSVEICGLPMRNASLEARKMIGYQSGDTQLYDRLSPREILSFFADIYEMPKSGRKDLIERLLEDFSITSFADKRFAALSSGQKQRVALARSIVHDPAVLILDEVTASLDVLSSRFVMEYLASARLAGKAVLYSTHILAEAEYLCDHIILIHGGRILAEGTARGLMEISGTANLTECFFAFLARLEATP
jgi:sodium transport system ATP-binding protein